MGEAYYFSGEKVFPHILAFCICEQLLEDGILRLPVKYEFTEDEISSVYYFNQLSELRRSKSSDIILKAKTNGLYTPSFISVEKWNPAVEAFERNIKLFENVSKHLMPAFDDTMAELTEHEKAGIVVHYLKLNGVMEKPVRQVKGNSYYFDQNEIYRIDKGSVLYPYSKMPRYGIFEIRGQQFFNLRLWTKSVSKFKEGMSLTECANIFLKEELIQNTEHIPLSFLEQLIQYIEPVVFERFPENLDQNTFDRIRVTVCLPRSLFDSWDELVAAVKENKKHIDKQVVDRIQQNRKFKKMGIPLSFFGLSNLHLARDYTLEYIFEIKK